MKQWIKKISVVILILVIGIGTATKATQPTYAAGANVSIAVSGSNVKVGDSVTVTVTISSDSAIGSYSMAVTYNSAVLEYVSGDGNGGGGTVLIANTAKDGSTTRLSASLTFRAIANGSSAIATSGGEAYGWDESGLSISHASVTVNVTPPATTAASTTAAATEGGTTAATTETDRESMDVTLKSLELEPGELEPAFQSSVTTYTVHVPETTTAIVVSAVANDSNAAVTVSHNDDLEPGANKVYIIVTAKDGSQGTYTLNVYCGDTEEELQELTIDGIVYRIVSQEEMENVVIPDGFQSVEVGYGEERLSAYESPNQKLHILYLLDEQGEGHWFLYDVETESFSPYIEFVAASNRYVVLDKPEELEIPLGYEPVEAVIQEQTVTAYCRSDMPDFLLVYATNLYEDAGFYLYDTVESTFQRYINVDTTLDEEIETEVSEVEESENVESKQVKRLRILLYIVTGITVVLLVTLVGLMRELKKRFLS